ncbi:MAG TPA: extracellular solute-binding protein [Clostridiaceae bacterium]|nr:extracellular solute-binding protein [Clostridiaceae bacterium]
MFKKALIVLLVLAMVVSMFAGCQKSETPTTKEQTASQDSNATTTVEKKDFTLKVWTFQTFSNETDQRVIDQIQKFSQTSGVNVVVETVPETTYTPKFTASLEAGALPDVMCMRPDHINITYPNIPFLDITQIYREIEKNTGRKFIEGYVEHLTAEGKVYAIPFFTSGQPGVYRTDLFKKAGYDKLPETWDEICEAALKVSDPSNGIYGLGIGCGPTDNDGETALRLWIWSEGGALFDKDGNPDPVQPGTIKVVQKYVELYKAGAVPKAATTWDAGGNNNSYLLRESALIFNPFTVVNAMKGNKDYEDLLENTGATTLPKGSVGHFTKMFTTGGFAINAKCKHVDAAQQLLEFLCEKEWYNSFVALSAPLNPPVFEDAAEIEPWSTDPYCKIMIDMSLGQSGWFGYPCDTIEARKAGALVFNNYLLGKAITRIIQENLDVEEGLKLLKKDMEDLLNRS